MRARTCLLNEFRLIKSVSGAHASCFKDLPVCINPIFAKLIFKMFSLEIGHAAFLRVLNLKRKEQGEKNEEGGREGRRSSRRAPRLPRHRSADRPSRLPTDRPSEALEAKQARRLADEPRARY